MMRKLNHPAFIFIILGTLVFFTVELGGRLFGKSGNSEFKPVRISSSELVDMKKRWERSNRATADLSVLKYFVDNTACNEILFYEAIKLGFHLTDSVVWRRLVQNMRFVEPDTSKDEEELFEQALAIDMHLSDLVVKRRMVARMEQFIKSAHTVMEPDDSDVDRFINDNPGLLARGEQISFSHVFISPDGNHGDSEKYGNHLLKKLRKENMEPRKAYKLGDMFPLPFSFNNTGRSYIKKMFGENFADDIITGKTGTWAGPFESNYGTHLVRLESRTVTPVSDLPENRSRARNYLTIEREKKLIHDVVSGLQHRYYTVLIDEIPAGSFRLEQLLDT